MTFITKPLVFICTLLAAYAAYAADAWQEDFDGPLTPFGSAVIGHRLVNIAQGQGVKGSNSIRVAYEGYELGSKRVVVRVGLPRPAMAYTLSFAVKFCEGFDFAKGGKLHGLGPKVPVTGGNPLRPSGWSARLAFSTGGGLSTYVYHQNLPGKYGQGKAAQDFSFVPGRYYQIEMRVALNEPATSANGEMIVWVDGKELIRHGGLQLRAVEGEDGLIQTVLFSTFHGGNSPAFAPRTADGGHKIDCAYFDDWAVRP